MCLLAPDLSVCAESSAPTRPSICLSVCISVCVSVCPFASLPTYQSVSESLRTSPLSGSAALVPAHPLCAWLQVSSNQRGVNASQLNIGGTGLGSFNDRFRDAVVGGSPFASPLFQGWVTGQVPIPPGASNIKCGLEANSSNQVQCIQLHPAG